MWKKRIDIPPNSHVVHHILKEYHDSATGGYSGVAKTIERICSIFYWPKMQ